MVTIYLNRQIDDPVRRTSIYNGDFYLYTGIQEAVALRDHARSMIAQAFAGIDPQRAQYILEVPEFVKRVGPLKSRFTNDARTKELVRDFLIALGCDPITTFFDLPRLRAVPSNNYLTAGVSYAYKAHRDTWYAHPPMLVNYWVPIYTVVGDNVMSMWPGYFQPAGGKRFSHLGLRPLGCRSALPGGGPSAGRKARTSTPPGKDRPDKRDSNCG
jgi:hypothetical protein